MDDLARDLLEFFKERAFKAPLSFPQVPGLDERQLLVVLLLFADDILALGLTPIRPTACGGAHRAVGDTQGHQAQPKVVCSGAGWIG